MHGADRSEQFAAGCRDAAEDCRGFGRATGSFAGRAEQVSESVARTAGSTDVHHPVIVYDYTPTRSRAGPAKSLEGYKGYLQADAYSVYDALFKPQRGSHRFYRGPGHAGPPLPGASRRQRERFLRSVARGCSCCSEVRFRDSLRGSGCPSRARGGPAVMVKPFSLTRR